MDELLSRTEGHLQPLQGGEADCNGTEGCEKSGDRVNEELVDNPDHHVDTRRKPLVTLHWKNGRQQRAGGHLRSIPETQECRERRTDDNEADGAVPNAQQRLGNRTDEALEGNVTKMI